MTAIAFIFLVLLALAGATSNVTTPTYTIFFGPSRAGKNYCANQILAEGQPHFFMADGDSCVSKEISFRTAWNNDTVVTVPGIRDAYGEEMIHHQAEFVDFVKDKRVRAFVFVYTDGLDQFIKTFLERFASSDLKPNIIILKNMLPNDEPLEAFNGFLGLNVKMYNKFMNDVPRTEFVELKRMIASMTPVLVTNMVVPMSLFTDPLVNKGTLEAEEYLEDRTVIEMVIQNVTRNETIMVTRCHREMRRGPFGLGRTIREVCHDEPETRIVTDTMEVPVEKAAKVYRKYTLHLAERFDGLVDVHSKEFTGLRTEVVG
jgi:hypothetical protein